MQRSISPQSLKNLIHRADWHILDVRRQSDLNASSEQLPGATWHDPEQVTEWMVRLPKDKNLVLYCARGGSVSNSVVDTLQGQGLKVCFIEGGIEGWKTAGGQTVPKKSSE